MTYNCVFEWITKFIPIIKDLCIAFAAVGGFVIALLGLRTWWRELKGKTEYDLARKILTSVYKFRNAIERVRNPFMSASEYGSTAEPGKSAEEIKYEGTAKAYQTRWEPVYQALVQLDEATAEAEALWGSQINEVIKSLKDCSKELLININHYLLSLRSKQALTDKQVQKIDSIIYSGDGPEKDEFYRKLLEAIKKIEEMLKRHLMRR